jgi:hypothetical protein
VPIGRLADHGSDRLSLKTRQQLRLFGVEFLGRDNIPLPQVGQALDPRKISSSVIADGVPPPC